MSARQLWGWYSRLLAVGNVTYLVHQPLRTALIHPRDVVAVLEQGQNRRHQVLP